MESAIHLLWLGWLPVCDRQQKTLAWLSEGCLCHQKAGGQCLTPFIGGAAAKVNPESVLSGAMVLGLAGPTKGGPHDHFHRRRAA